MDDTKIVKDNNKAQDMSWVILGNIFDCNGVLNIRKKNKGSLAFIRIYSEYDLLDKIKEFTCYGFITLEKKNVESYRYELESKEELLDFLLNVREHANLRKPMIDYLLANYNFSKSLNEKFNKQEFKNLVKEWTKEVKKKKLLARQELLEKFRKKLKSGEELTPEENKALKSKYLEGGEE